MVPQVYYDVGFDENVNYYHNDKKLCFTNLGQPEVLRLEQSEHSYYTFRCIDLLSVTENRMILTSWCIGKSPYRKQKRGKKLGRERPKFVTLFFDTFIITFKSLYCKPHRMHICELKYRMRWSGTIYNIIINRGYYMAARVCLRVLKNISLFRYAHSWNILSTRISKGPCNVLLII